MSSNKISVGEYLVKRLEECGLGHIFGVPGDYILGFYDQLVASNIELVGTCTEAGAGFAADAYARLNGLGAVAVTYCVGGFNLVNSVAGAYAEKSPLVVISGGPGVKEKNHSQLLHHMVKDFNTQKDIFEKITASAIILDDAKTAPAQIDEALQLCLEKRLPVYIELPRDVVHQECRMPKSLLKESMPESLPNFLKEAVDEAAAMLKAAKNPVIVAGVEIHRFGLEDSLLNLVESSGYPVTATLLGKSVIRENHPQYIGLYQGRMGSETVRQQVEDADCILMLGAFMTDINLGIFTAQLEMSKMIKASSETIAIKYHNYENVVLKDFVDALAKELVNEHKSHFAKEDKGEFKIIPEQKLTIARVYEQLNSFLGDDSLVITDSGDCMFAASDLVVHRRTEFMSPAYYTSMGFAVPATLGAMINKPDSRAIVLVGDGAFQMTSQELSTIVRHKLNPIIIVLNNKGYTTERFINEGPYNDIHNWQYHKWTELLDAGHGYEANTEADFAEVLAKAKENKEFSIINVHLEPLDHSKTLARLGSWLRERVKA